MFVAEERGFHTLPVEDFLPQISGINTQSREITRGILQEENVAPSKILRKLKDLGIADKDLPSRLQINTFKMSLKKDHSDNSKYRLQNFHQLKEHFTESIVTSKQQYEDLGISLACLLCFTISLLYSRTTACIFFNNLLMQ